MISEYGNVHRGCPILGGGGSKVTSKIWKLEGNVLDLEVSNFEYRIFVVAVEKNQNKHSKFDTSYQGHKSWILGGREGQW